ncbi:MAG: multiprotein-bridging factor 1 family protein [Halobacteriales archaeon]
MAKYSTGDSSGGDGGDTCELCGEPSDSLRRANVAGATLQVCRSCAPHDDAKRERSGGASEEENTEDRNRRAVRNAARTSPNWDGDTSHWEEEGTDYEEDRLPYLASNYGEIVLEARQNAGLQREELAEELGVRESDLLAVEQGRATRAGVGGSLIAALEERLDVELSEEP